jgi:hypothetical protein
MSDLNICRIVKVNVINDVLTKVDTLLNKFKNEIPKSANYSAESRISIFGLVLLLTR